jgi:hypothetical protein
LNSFNLYFLTGWQHIVSTEALDHILFIIALCALYTLQQWKQVLVLVTAFTIGHSLTLALSVYDVVRFSSSWVEFLIPCTIFVTAVLNLIKPGLPQKKLPFSYLLALLFGLVHGMGFANTIRFMLAGDETIAWPLFSFNLGLEAGQVLVVALLLLLAFVSMQKLKMPRQNWVYLLSVPCMLLALKMMLGRWPL